MDKIVLLDTAIQEGKELISALVERGISIQAAFWLYSSADNSWKLLLASSNHIFSITGRLLPAYQIIVDCLQEIQAKTLTEAEIQIIGLNDPLVKALATAFQVKDGSIRLQNTRINQFYLEDIYIYQMDMTKKKERSSSKNMRVKKNRITSKPSKT